MLTQDRPLDIRPIDPIDPTFARSFVADTSTTNVPPELIDRLTGEVLKVPARVWKRLTTSSLM